MLEVKLAKKEEELEEQRASFQAQYVGEYATTTTLKNFIDDLGYNPKTFEYFPLTTESAPVENMAQAMGIEVDLAGGGVGDNTMAFVAKGGGVGTSTIVGDDVFSGGADAIGLNPAVEGTGGVTVEKPVGGVSVATLESEESFVGCAPSWIEPVGKWLEHPRRQGKPGELRPGGGALGKRRLKRENGQRPRIAEEHPEYEPAEEPELCVIVRRGHDAGARSWVNCWLIRASWAAMPSMEFPAMAEVERSCRAVYFTGLSGGLAARRVCLRPCTSMVKVFLVLMLSSGAAHLSSTMAVSFDDSFKCSINLGRLRELSYYLVGIQVSSTVDPLKETPLVTTNTILSILVVDYPMDKVSCYVFDDGAAMLPFEALSETSEFANLFVFLSPSGGLGTDGNQLPRVVYVSREKRPEYNHHKKPSAMNALVWIGFKEPFMSGRDALSEDRGRFDAPKTMKSHLSRSCNCLPKWAYYGYCYSGNKKKKATKAKSDKKKRNSKIVKERTPVLALDDAKKSFEGTVFSKMF
ncbi:hypothetical protein GIB67_005648 [Kingdonia uniflora]|uniref:Uncharacterized protein n=1 Tax=Kingdonia uniflora TaxID=39325 RepID=A0A7J7NIH1_9MAGN|nr:hypothetical protein GIB67_005648 [Kingdonia uniflora]